MLRNRSIRYRLEFWIAAGGFALLRSLPESVAYGIGEKLGKLLPRLAPSRAGIVIDSLQRAFPEKTGSEINQLSKKMFVNLGRVLVDFALMGRWKKDDWEAKITVAGMENIDRAKTAGRGIVFLSAHLGSWELLGGAVVNLLGIPLTAVARPMKNPLADRLFLGYRHAAGIKTVPHRGSFRALLKILKSGESVGLLLDQHTAPHEAVLCRFFDRPAATNYGLALLAMKSGAPVIPIFLVREGRTEYRLILDPPLRLDDPGREGRDEAIASFSQQCTSIIEEKVRRHPDQWFWVHRRWKAEKKLDSYERRAV